VALTPAELLGVTEGIWSILLGVGIEPMKDDPGRSEEPRVLAGCVAIHGAWEGKVVLECTPKLVRSAAAALLDVDPDQASDEDLRDTLGELTNMLAGNVKGLLPEPCQLALPTVLDCQPGAVELLDDFEPLIGAVYRCVGEPQRVQLLKRRGG
jgi:chemotaxis protein CheX